jgi:hypothetical protein
MCPRFRGDKFQMNITLSIFIKIYFMTHCHSTFIDNGLEKFWVIYQKIYSLKPSSLGGKGRF